MLTISARSQPALRALAVAYRDQLRRQPSGPIRDLCGTSRTGRARMSFGLAVEGGTAQDLADALESYVSGSRSDMVTAVEAVPHRRRKLAWLFTGQGAQYSRMGQDLRGEPAYREALDEVATLADPLLDRPLLDILELPEGPDSPLDQTRYTQPSIFAVEYALARLWQSWGIRPDAVLGHSVGEITAACVAGVLTLPDAVRLVVERGRLMQSLPPGGVMATVVCDEARARRAIGDRTGEVAVAAVNGPADTVIAGAAPAVADIVAELLEEGIKARYLRVSHAFHSPLLHPVLPGLAAVAERLTHHAPELRLISNVTGEDWSERQGTPRYWVEHAAAPVRFADGIRTLHESGVETFLDVGPAPVLLGLAARTVDDPRCLWIPSLRRGRDATAQMVSAAGALHLRGMSLDWRAFDGPDAPRRVPLPTYPWEGERYWFEQGQPDERVIPAVDAPATRLPGPVPVYRLRELPHLADLVELSARAMEEVTGFGWTAVEEAEAFVAGDQRRDWYLSLERVEGDRAEFVCRGRTPVEEVAGAPWTVAARGVLRRAVPLPDEAPEAGKRRDVRPGAGPGGLVREAVSLVAGNDEPVRRLAGLTWTPHRAAATIESDDAGALVFRAEDGTVVGALREVHVDSPVEREPAAPWRDPGEILFDLRWHPVEPPGSAADAGGGWLLVSDGDGLAEDVAAVLRGRGAPCLVEHSVEAALDRLGDSAHVVLLTGVNAPDLSTAEAAELVEFRDRVELGAIRLVQALRERPRAVPTRVHLVTRGAVAAVPEQRLHAAAASPLWGLGRVVALEHPELWGGAVDLDPDAPIDAALLASALGGQPAEDQLAIRGGSTLGARLVRRDLAPSGRDRRADVRADATYLVTGGFGGIGSTIATWLAEQGAGGIVLASRTPISDAPADRSRTKLVSELRARGVEVEAVALDVSDVDAVGRLVRRLAGGPRRLRGVIHAAGVSRPQLLREVNRDGYDAAWRPKVLGTFALHRATVDHPLDFMLGFSSIAGVWGSRFLASYAAGNAFLDGLAHHRRSLGHAGLSIDWGQWDLGSNLYGSDVRDFLAGTGLQPLAPGQCLRLLGALLAGDDVQRVVCAADWTKYKAVLESRTVRPMLALVDDGARVTTGGDGGTPLRDRVVAAEPSRRRELVAAYLRDELAQIMRLDRQTLDGPFNLLEMGIDSLMVMELISRIRQDVGVDFTSRDFFATDAGSWDEFVLDAISASSPDADLDD
ncbi:SDR family NAD(P)-dependent oxidoreductase [Micromonospora sp. LOL_015]|uniref:SDR family NAD(P)-dependent oxidoreductase n=1 Tax=Micromonospora sp. LOL_015 TaxID=3345416 RepID=UPI003A8791C4